MTARIFISYSSKDSEIAKFIHDELIKRGVDVFIDYRGLDEGDDFHERLAGEIKSRDRVLFLVSQHSIASSWVRVELKFAFKHHKAIVPLALDDSEIPDALFFVDMVHRRTFTRSNEDMTRLCKVLGVTEEKQAAAPKTDPTPAKTDLSPDSSPNSGRGEKPLPAPIVQRKSSIDLMPAPFAWIDIPGKIGKQWADEPYKIAKYPVTNAQYKVFIDAGGYENKQWWTKAGWAALEREKWTLPRYWTEQNFNGADQPVVGVSWFESVAFCLWLGSVMGEKIMLPSDNQWQYAAQGDDGRAYPWGSQWRSWSCNTNKSKLGKTTPVREHEGKGDSPFGVVDMAGNVWEWCATSYDSRLNNINMNAQYRVLRGGSWDNDPRFSRADYRNGSDPNYRNNYNGFRVGVGSV